MVHDPEVQDLLDKDQIHDLAMRYCRGIDRGDGEIIGSVFHGDATVDYGMFVGTVADFVPFILANIRTFERVSHNVSNEFVLVDGGKAWAEYYVVAYSCADLDGQLTDAMIGGRYLDRLDKRDGVWKIAHRQFVMDWNQNAPSTAEWDEGMYGELRVRGTQGKDDPVYSL